MDAMEFDLSPSGLEMLQNSDEWQPDRALVRFADGCIYAARHRDLPNLELYLTGSPSKPESFQLVFLLGGYSDSLATAMEAARIVARIVKADEEDLEKWAKNVNGDFMMAVPTHTLSKELCIDGEGVEEIRNCGDYQICLTVALRRSKMTQAYTLRAAA